VPSVEEREAQIRKIKSFLISLLSFNMAATILFNLVFVSSSMITNYEDNIWNSGDKIVWRFGESLFCIRTSLYIFELDEFSSLLGLHETLKEFTRAIHSHFQIVCHSPPSTNSNHYIYSYLSNSCFLH